MCWIVTSVLSGKTSVERDMNYWDGNGRWSLRRIVRKGLLERTWDRHMREAAMGISGEESSRHGKCKGPEASKCKHIQETPQRSQTWNRVGEGLLGGPKRVREEADHLGLLDPRGETTGEFLEG